MRNLIRRPPYRLPTVLGLLFLLISLFAGVFLVKNNQIFFLRADPDIVPREVRITNITDTSFVVSWVTEGQVSGFVKVEEGQGAVFADDRDQASGQIGKFTTHYVTARDLSPLKKYFFKIGSGGKIFDSGGKPFVISTGATVFQPPPPADPAYGKVETKDGRPAEGAIVYLSLPNVAPQSALVKSSGSWLVTLSLARSADLANYASYDRQASEEEIFVQGGDLGTISTVLSTSSDSPAPTFTLGKDLGLAVVQQEGGEPTPTLLSVPQMSGFRSEPTSFPTIIPQPGIELKITYPAEGEYVASSKPEFSGQGPVRKVLTIILNSQGFFGEVLTDEQGNWSWSPPDDLEPGRHKLLVRFEDDQGEIQTIEHQFTVLAADQSDLPSFTSTPSATPPPVTISPVVPSPTLTLTPTLPPRTTQPSTEPGIPQPGFLTPTFLISIMGIGIFGMGLLLKKRLSLISNF